MKKEVCKDEFDGSICLRPKGHLGKHIDGVCSKFGPWAWTDQGKARVLRERAGKLAATKKQQG